MFQATHLIGFGSKRRAAGTVWTTAVDITLNGNQSGFSGSQERLVIASAALTSVASPQKIRVTLAPPSSGNNTQLAALWIGHVAGAGDAYDFDGNQVQIKFGGSNSVTLTAGGGTTLSDEIAWTFYDSSKNLICAFEFSGTTDLRVNASPGTNFTRYNKGGSGESGTSNVTSYNNQGNYAHMIDLIEIGA